MIITTKNVMIDTVLFYIHMNSLENAIYILGNLKINSNATYQKPLVNNSALQYRKTCMQVQQTP